MATHPLSSVVYRLSSIVGTLLRFDVLRLAASHCQATEAYALRPLVIAVEADLGAPARVCQRLDHVSHQRAALEWCASIAFHQVAKPNFGRKIAGDLVGGEPRERHDFDIRLRQ